MAKHLKMLMKTIHTHTQEAQTQEIFKNCTIIKLLKMTKKEEILKAAREKVYIMYRETRERKE